MKTIDIDEARANFEALIAATAASGEGFVLTRNGVAIARVLPITTKVAAPATRIGFMKGKLGISCDTNPSLDDEVRALFEG
ncbi:type II toxin-antitoxin system Phd/YefM family antitoxin [Caulobacter sp. 73W]|uniref:Antitoxin n=1 Tax=Caulobacter sp. 73W TaxID=3161137 RepID=A0AB39KRT1_9CAUL